MRFLVFDPLGFLLVDVTDPPGNIAQYIFSDWDQDPIGSLQIRPLGGGPDLAARNDHIARGVATKLVGGFITEDTALAWRNNMLAKYPGKFL